MPVIALVSGCSSAPTDSDAREAAVQYFAENTTAARSGPQQQARFFTATQHPDFADRVCDLGSTTVEFDPALSTLRPDPEFTTAGQVPRGSVWVVAVEVTIREQGRITAHQIGSQHLVLLRGEARGFAPCLS
nr:hypothetical protein [Saccharopolyspora sp. HNM0983]